MTDTDQDAARALLPHQQVRMIEKKSAREILRQEIESLQRELDKKLDALDALDKAESEATGTEVKTYRYLGIRHTHPKIRMYLERVNVLKTEDEIARELIDGGGMFGKDKRRARQNVHVSVMRNAGLEFVGDRIGLSEWFQEGGKYSHLTPDKKAPLRGRVLRRENGSENPSSDC